VKIVDISLSLTSSMPIWPGSVGFHLAWINRLEQGHHCNNSSISCNTHLGTHLDAPLHFIRDGLSVDRLPLDVLIGPCQVVHFPDKSQITSNDLTPLDLPQNTSRLLLRTDNSNLWAGSRTDFEENFVALTADAARWIVKNNIRLVGNDYLSIGSYREGVDTHQILLEAGVIILEGLKLHGVAPDKYELICLPIKIAGAEGAPARAV